VKVITFRKSRGEGTINMAEEGVSQDKGKEKI